MWKYLTQKIFIFRPVMYFYILMDVCNSDETNVSDKVNCNDGFIGPNCGIRCPYPSFGKACQSKCNCPEMFCNVTTGCEDGSQTVSPGLQITKGGNNSAGYITFTTKACSPGYTGNSCEVTCRYPSYGLDCQRECVNCSRKQCHHVTGCYVSSHLCPLEDRTRHNLMVYSIVILSIWMSIQFSVYLYLTFIFKKNN